MKTLLEQAKEIKIRKINSLVNSATKQEIELAIGWATDEITLGKFSKIIWNKDTSKGVGSKALYTIASWLKAAIKKGILK